MNDLAKSDDEICYYLQGPDKEYFHLNSTLNLLQPMQRMDREVKSKFELTFIASEYCDCQLDTQLEHCSFLSNNDDYNDVSQLKLNIYLEDIDDNPPRFIKKLYQTGITSDVEFDETILESYVILNYFTHLNK